MMGWEERGREERKESLMIGETFQSPFSPSVPPNNFPTVGLVVRSCESRDSGDQNPGGLVEFGKSRHPRSVVIVHQN